MAELDVASPETSEVVDNDVLLKAVRYGAVALMWQDGAIGILGAAPFVVGKRVRKLAKERPDLEAQLQELLDLSVLLEPADEEVALAAEIELAALRRALPLDSGESQLVAITVTRGIPVLTTGDKRAISAFEALLGEVQWLEALCGRVRCLEQLVLDCARGKGQFEALAAAVCSDREADTTLAICFGCFGGGSARNEVEQGLHSYIEALRSHAARVLAAAP